MTVGGGTDTLIGINQIQGTSNNDLVWGGPQGIQFQGNGGNDTLIGSALAIDANFENTIDYSEDPGRALGGVTDTTYAGVRVNLSDTTYTYTLTSNGVTVTEYLAAGTGYNGFGGTAR